MSDNKSLSAIPENILLQYIPQEVLRENIIDTNFPNYELYTLLVGKTYGHAIERKIINERFSDTLPSDNSITDYDATCNGLRIEIKSSRVLRNNSTKREELGLSFWEDAASINDEKYEWSSPWQQVKPTYCDYFIFHALYKDGSRYFVVPSRCIASNIYEESPDVIRLGKQHPSPDEGVVNNNTIAKKNAHIFEITDDILNLQDAINLVEERLKTNTLILPKPRKKK